MTGFVILCLGFFFFFFGVFLGYILGPQDVRVRMKAVGICGSDVHYLKVISFSLLLHFEC